jgi:hypothetical protein
MDGTFFKKDPSRIPLETVSMCLEISGRFTALAGQRFTDRPIAQRSIPSNRQQSAGEIF